MSAKPFKVLHVAPYARGIGGIETLLARHAEADRAAGFDAWQIGLFNRGGGVEKRFRAMAFGWRNSPWAMRRRMQHVLAEHADSIVIWHGAWGLPWFAEFDGAFRRIAYLYERGFEAWLPAIRHHLDGILAMSPAVARDVARLLPGWPEERIGYLPVPIVVPPELRLTRPIRDTFIIGCAGRLTRAQKRWDRLVPCVAELRRLNVNFRVEIIGDGPLRPWLERQFRGDPAVAFLGFVDTTEYWRRMESWDATLFFSDVEGGPIVLLEAMAAGALPIYPAIGGSLGDDYARRIDPRCYYPAGDPISAARNLHALLASSTEELAVRRVRARSLAEAHTTQVYEANFAAFVRQIAALPRISRRGGPRRATWTDVLPLGLITRTLPAQLWR